MHIRMYRAWFCLVILVVCMASAQAQAPRPMVLLISIDGLRPDSVTAAEQHGLRVPNLRRFLTEGAYAERVRGVVPTVTYPSHTTLITGVSPAKHGVYSNNTFDPFWKNFDGWYWYAEDIRVPTLWDQVMAAGMVTANVHWPVSVGAKITYNLPQIWRSGNADDRKLVKALSTPGLVDAMEKDLGPYADGIGESMTGDEIRGRFAVHMLEHKRPNFMTAYLTALDHDQHETGHFSERSIATLEKIDAIVGDLYAAARRTGGAQAVVCVVSDHGFARTSKQVNLFGAFRSAGLMEFDDKDKVTSWQASPWASGGTAAIMINPSAGSDVRGRVEDLLRRLAADPENGIARVIDGKEAAAMGGYPEAAFVVDMKPGYLVGRNTSGPLVTPTKTQGMHGYLPTLPDMASSFFIIGPGVAAGRNLGEIDMRDIAPTLAKFLGVTLPGAEGKEMTGKLLAGGGAGAAR